MDNTDPAVGSAQQRFSLHQAQQSVPVLLFEVATSEIELSPFYRKRLQPGAGPRDVSLQSGELIGGIAWPDFLPRYRTGGLGLPGHTPDDQAWLDAWLPKPTPMPIGQRDDNAHLWLQTKWLRADEHGYDPKNGTVAVHDPNKLRMLFAE